MISVLKCATLLLFPVGFICGLGFGIFLGKNVGKQERSACAVRVLVQEIKAREYFELRCGSCSVVDEESGIGGVVYELPSR